VSNSSETPDHSESSDPQAELPVIAPVPEMAEAAIRLPFPIVGIGASAGGLEPLMGLFSHLPANTGMAFVVVPHLAPDQKSHLPEILGTKTAMPVSEISHHSQPEPNHVYILPPNSFVSLTAGVLELQPRPEDPRSRMPVDHFFRSLAAHQKNRAVGVILSGTDSDGAMGLRTIKGEGGIAIVQHPETARFPGMPRSSIAADHVDLIVNPPEIGTELAQLALRFATGAATLTDSDGAGVPDEVQFARILTSMRAVSGVDFRLYKPETIRRRVARRMMLNKIDSMQEYVKYLQTHANELRQLHEEALIGVTRFFRDPDVFQVFQSQIVPRIFQERPGDQQIRIWVPGCSSGEEAYSIAMCLLEFIATQSFEPAIQIFGTDASDASIERARLGMYPESIIADVSADRLRRFFARVEKGYQISKRVRDLCIFARQNLCSDPPFSKLDMISCRNVLIYFGASLQRQLIQTFSYALRPNGYLLLGTAETLRESGDLFTLLDRKSKFHAKVASVTPIHFAVPNHLAPAVPQSAADAPGFSQGQMQPWTELELQRAVDRLVLARYGPAGLVINDRLEVLQFRGQTGQLVNMAAGPASLQLHNILNRSLASPVREAVYKAIEQDAPVRLNDVKLREEGRIERFAIEVLPVSSVPVRPRCFVILFIPEQQPRLTKTAHSAIAEAQAKPGELDRQEIAQLKDDLSSAKIYLQSLIEERDARDQELISANEEIQSANEELQSTNEELETTKEELQSSNEELQTINEELQQRNAALTQTTNDFNNLFTSVNIPVLMLNNELQIRQYTSHTQKLMNIRPIDIGRPITDIRLNLNIENLQPLLEEVLETLNVREMEVRDRDGRWYLLRVRPYRTSENKIDGVVLVLVDIDQVRKSQQELQAARDFATAVTESVGIPIVVMSPDFRIRNANSAFRQLAKRPTEDLAGQFLPEVAEHAWNMSSIRPMLEKLTKQAPNGPALEAEHEVSTPEFRALQTRGRVVQIDGERVLLLLIEDITGRKQAGQIIDRERQLLESRVLSTVQALGRTQDELRALSASLFQAQEDERRRVARELHDDISQRLAVLGIDLQHAADAAGGDSEARKIIASLASRTDVLADDVRKISHGLHPSMLDDLGLAYALKALGDEFSEREKMLVTWQRQDIPEHIPQNVAATFYRITQEALRNVSKHAGRTHVKITLAGLDGRLRLEIADFGEGFDTEDARHGLGLISMSERARLVQGTLSVNSALGKGTTVTIEAPLRLDEQENR
jgi:two-component system, chemotaxis family, CheB/CheR fusion protein